MNQAGQDIKQSFSDAPVKSALTAIPGALEPAAAFVGNTVAGAGAVLHSALDKVPGSRFVGDFDPKKTFAQRRAEYEQGIGQFTNPQTRIGQNFTDAMGAVLKPVGDAVALPGKAAGSVAGLFGASPETQESISEQTTAVANAALMAKSMRPQKAPAGQPVPTKSELKASSQQAYTDAKNAGATVTPQSFAKKTADLTNYLKKEGLNKDLTPDAVAALKALSEHKGPLTIEQLDTYRKIASAAQSKAFMNKADARLAGKIVEAIDDYAEKLGPQDIIGGNAKAAVESLGEARGLWSRYRKTEAIDDLMKRAELRATQFSGSGLENAIRTEFRQLAMNSKKMRGFSEAEKAAIKKVAAGGPIENGLRMIGKAAPTGIVSAGMGTGAGLAIGGPVGAVAVPVAGAIARKGAEKMTMNNAARASEVMRRGPNNPMPTGPILPNVNPLMLGYNAQSGNPRQFADFLRSPLEQR